MKMPRLCDFCKEQRSMIYCQSDAAHLCLSCDRVVHSANMLSGRHSRTLICERCNCETAVVRCIEEKLSLCQNCNWSGHSAPSSSTEHKRQTISSYSGCPSAIELSRIWSFFYFDQSKSDPEAGLIIHRKGDENLSHCPTPPKEAAVDMIDSDVEQFHGIDSLNSPKQKDLDISDIDWSLENCEALFGESLDDPQHFFNKGGFDSMFEIGNLCGDECTDECIHVAKGTSSIDNTMQQACSSPVSADSDASSKSDPKTCLPQQAQSSFLLSFPDQTVECSSGAHQECEMSSVIILTGEHFNHHSPDNLLSSARRDSAVLRYKEKKKSRKFSTKIRYASRKAGADVRKRVKGRFVKAGEFYDYDPLFMTSQLSVSQA